MCDGMAVVVVFMVLGSPQTADRPKESDDIFLLLSSGRCYNKFSKMKCNYNSLIVSVIAML